MSLLQVTPPLHALELHGNMMSTHVTGGGVVMELGIAVSYLGERCCLDQLRLIAIDVAHHFRGVFAVQDAWVRLLAHCELAEPGTEHPCGCSCLGEAHVLVHNLEA